MVRGKKTNDSKPSTDWVLSGHLDDWAEIAVDYVDGVLDSPTRAAVQTHLDACPECSRRLDAQAAALAMFKEIPLAEAPAGLEAEVLERSLPAITSGAAAMRTRAHTRPWMRTLLSPSGPWLPATAVAVAVLALVLAMTVTREPGTLDDTMTTAAAGVASESAAEQASRGTEAGTDTTSAVLLGSEDSTAGPTEQVAGLTTDGGFSSASLQFTGPYVSDESSMASSLADATDTAYFFFDTAEGNLVTAQQADTIASRFTARTGLRLMDTDLSSGARAFAAFVPRDDAVALVRLLLSIGDSMQLVVCMSMQPGSEVTSWANAMLEDKYSLAELSASPSAAPPDTTWSYTTSTMSSTTTVSSVAPKATLLDEAGTHVLVVILMAVQE